MRLVRGLLVALLVAATAAVGVAGARAVEPPEYDGVLYFPRIQNIAEPEEYSWRVYLGEGQRLEAVDDQTAATFFEDGLPAGGIKAEPAHDKNGTNVPTTLSVTQPDIVTLTVHHREGNPLAGGAPFAYPIIAGTGWEGGFQTHQAEIIEPKRPAATPVAEPTAKPTKPPRVLVTRALGDGKLYYRPHFFLLSGDGTFGVGKVHWQTYGGASATATGRAFVDDCVPNCAAGQVSHPPAKLSLSEVVDCNGTEIYARLRYRLTGPLPDGFPRRGGYSMRPLSADGKPAC